MEGPLIHNGTKGKVLIVDDAPDTLEIIEKLLRFEGYDVITSLTGEEGVKKVEEEKPEVVLMDISLPGIDGTEALNRIRKINPLQCVIMLTAFATIDNAIQALKEGASDFVKKPFENEHLIHIVNQCLAKYRTLKEKENLEEEVKRLSDRIPNRDLAIQWDVAIEMIQWDGRRAPTFPGMAEMFRAAFARLSRAVPAEVELGYHLCYGDPEGHHVIEPEDCTKMVELANLIASVTDRPIAFIHLPMDPAREDDAFYAPLGNLKLPAGTETYLGLVHVGDGVAGATRRMKAARKFLPRFGIATPCGMNRAKTPATVLELLRIQARAAAA